MGWLRVAWQRMAGLLLKNKADRALAEELQSHIDALTSENVRRGLSAEEARYAARREFGGMEQIKEIYREQRGIPFLENVLQDFRFALRGLRRSPGFAAIAMITLALGIGANTAIFSVVYGILLRPLPNPQPERIVQITETYKGETYDKGFSYRELQFLKTQNWPMESLAGYTALGVTFARANDAERVNGLHVSSEYFQVLGMKPVLGRDFLPAEDRGDGTRVALLSYGLWRRRTGSDPNIAGQQIFLDGAAFTVVGVMPAGFERLNTPLTHGDTDVWVPLALVAHTVGSGQNLETIGRLKQGISLPQARAQAETLAGQFRKNFPNQLGPEATLGVARYQSMLSSDIRTMLLALFGAVAFVLLIASANVANLLLGRAAARTKEIAVRTALGATRGRLVRQMLTESLLLSLVGALLGLAVARCGLAAMLAVSPRDLPRAMDIHLDGWAFGFSFLVALFIGVLFGLAPALKVARSVVSESLKEGSGRTSGGRQRTRFRNALVVSEIALSLVLLTGAALLIRTFWQVLKTDPGFNPARIASVQTWLAGTKYNSTPEVAQFYDEALGKIAGIPGVESAAVVAAGLPLERGVNMAARVPGSDSFQSCDFRMITPDYFHTLRIPVKLGKGFAASDNQLSRPVVVVNESFARLLWPGKSAVGEHLEFADEKSSTREVIGIVGDVKSHLDQPAEPTAFIPIAQGSYPVMKILEGWFPTVVVVRTSVEPLTLARSVTEAIHEVNPSVPTGAVRTMEQVRSTDVAMREFNMILLSVFAGLALLLAAIGIYGVMAYNVAQRVREIGIRMALGANPSEVLRSVLREGLLLTGIGAALGVAGALAITRVLKAYLFGVSATDPYAFAGTALLLGLVALAACWVPARRATRVDPIVALRYE